MFYHVKLQSVSLDEAFVALLAFIRFLSYVDALVHLQITFQSKTFMTLIAHMGLLSRMDLLVS